MLFRTRNEKLVTVMAVLAMMAGADTVRAAEPEMLEIGPGRGFSGGGGGGGSRSSGGGSSFGGGGGRPSYSSSARATPSYTPSVRTTAPARTTPSYNPPARTTAPARTTPSYSPSVRTTAPARATSPVQAQTTAPRALPKAQPQPSQKIVKMDAQGRSTVQSQMGKGTKTEHLAADGTLKRVEQRDKSGQLRYEKVFNKDHTLQSERSFHKDGTIAKQVNRRQDGSISSEKRVDARGNVTYQAKYSTNGRVKQQTYYDHSGQVTHTSSYTRTTVYHHSYYAYQPVYMGGYGFYSPYWSPFYQPAFNPWWSYDPWISAYGYQPWGVYPSVSYLIAESIIAQSLAEQYAMNAAATQQANASRQQQDSQNAPVQLSEQQKKELADQVEQDLRSRAQHTSEEAQQEPVALDKHLSKPGRIFVVSSELDGAVDGASCTLSVGDLLKVVMLDGKPMINEDGLATVQVQTAKHIDGECKARQKVQISAEDLVNFDNDFSRHVDQGVKDVKKHKDLSHDVKSQ